MLTATTEIYTFPYTTLFRSDLRQAGRQVALVCGVAPASGRLREDRHALLVGGQRAPRVSCRQARIADLGQADREVPLSLSGMALRQLLRDRQIVLISLERTGDVAQRQPRVPQLLVARREIAPEAGIALPLGQRPKDLQARPVDRQRAPGVA